MHAPLSELATSIGVRLGCSFATGCARCHHPRAAGDAAEQPAAER